MNQLIKELALQAWQSVNDQVRNQKTLMPDTEISQDDITDIFEEKFAQLIVRECIVRALEEKVEEEEIDQEDDIEALCYLRGNNGGIYDAVIRIKQHFGVE